MKDLFFYNILAFNLVWAGMRCPFFQQNLHVRKVGKLQTARKDFKTHQFGLQVISYKMYGITH